MARKTKEEALATRARLLEAAEAVFGEQGVACTSLHEIACRAGLTRGAVYWHFANKSELLTALWQEVALPMRQAMEETGLCLAHDPLERIRQRTRWVAKHIETDPRKRAVMTILLIRCEFTEETKDAYEHLLNERERALAQMSSDFQQAYTMGLLAPKIDVERAALGLSGLIDGICLHWLIDTTRFSIQETIQQATDAYLLGMTAQAQPPEPARAAP